MSSTILLIAAYFAVLAALSLAALPYRKRLRARGAELLAMDLNPQERRIVENMLKHAYSWRLAIIMFLVFATGLFQDGDVLDQSAARNAAEKPNLAKTRRFHEFTDAFFASVVGVNPLVGLFAMLARAAFRLKARLHHSSKAVERISDLRAAEAV